MKSRHLLGGIVLLVVLPAARPSESLRIELDKLAAAVANLREIKETGSIKVGTFDQKTKELPGVNSGPGLELMLSDLLKAHQIQISDEARYEVNGEYRFAQRDENTTTRVVKIEAKICNAKTGDTISDLRLSAFIIDDNKAISAIYQPTVPLDPNAGRDQRRESLYNAARHPTVHIHGPNQTRVSSYPGSPYAIEIRKKPLKSPSKAQPVPARNEKGHAFVDIDPGEVYEVHVFNDSGNEVAVSLSIDGIDNFHFAQDRRPDGRPEFSHWIMKKQSDGQPRKELNIPGWFNTTKDPMNTYRSFLVVGYGQGAVSEAGIKARGHVGVIRVGIFATAPLPPNAAPRSGNETGFGPPVGGNVAVVKYEVMHELESIAVRYTRPQE